MNQITERVFAETTTMGCNPSFVVTSDGVVMIDSPQQPSDAVRWKAEIGRHGIVRYLINTEPHADHVLGNWFFPTTVVGHEETLHAVFHTAIPEDMVKWLRENGFGQPPPSSKEGGPMGRFLDRFKITDPEGVRYLEGYELRAPSVTFSERMTLHVGGHTFQLFSLPGHTSGETAVLVPEERVVFTGDNVFNNVMPIIQDRNLVRTWMSSLRTIEAFDVDWVVPGHGEVGDKSIVGAMLAFLEELVGAVQRGLDAGWSRDETVERISYAGRFPVSQGMEAWAPFFQIRNVGYTYDELKGGLA